MPENQKVIVDLDFTCNNSSIKIKFIPSEDIEKEEYALYRAQTQSKFHSYLLYGDAPLKEWTLLFEFIKIHSRGQFFNQK